MGKKMIFYIIFGIIVTFAYYLFFDEVRIIDIVVFVAAYIAGSLIIEFILSKIRSNQKKDKTQAVTVDNTKITAFIEAVGGTHNLISTDFESSRVRVIIKNVDLIDQDKFRKLPLDGAYLAGNQLHMTVGAGSGDFSRQIQEAIEQNVKTSKKV